MQVKFFRKQWIKHMYNNKTGIYQVNSSSIMLEWSHRVYGAEEEVIHDVRGNFIVVNLLYITTVFVQYSVVSVHW